jgi:DNA-binding NarL/FixJ family response regulator
MPTFRVVSDPALLHGLTERSRASSHQLGADATAAASGTVYVAEVSDSAGAQQAVLAALRGADLLLAFTADDSVVDALIDDLHRLGNVVYETAPEVALTADQVDLLRRLHAGESLGAAAASMHLSRRTADRRLAMARAALGARTTAEALVEAASRGLLDQGSPP